MSSRKKLLQLLFFGFYRPLIYGLTKLSLAVLNNRHRNDDAVIILYLNEHRSVRVYRNIGVAWQFRR